MNACINETDVMGKRFALCLFWILWHWWRSLVFFFFGLKGSAIPKKSFCINAKTCLQTDYCISSFVDY